ncbi:MAG: hypothetical protein J1E06_01355 [Acutalibacter sp.]|nr:hypothetical protein [Acutalibacter sp.]
MRQLFEADRGTSGYLLTAPLKTVKQRETVGIPHRGDHLKLRCPHLPTTLP